MTDSEPKKQKRGFAAMSPEKKAEIARLGGIAAHKQGKAHEWSPEEASEAGKIGGKISRERYRLVNEAVKPAPQNQLPEATKEQLPEPQQLLLPRE